MSRRRSGYSIAILLGLILLALGYGGILTYHQTLTGSGRLDGMIGVMLGLFICARPAANLMDLLYQSASNRRHGLAVYDLWIWLLLNVFTLIVGLIVVIIGAIQFTRAAPTVPIL